MHLVAFRYNKIYDFWVHFGFSDALTQSAVS